MSREPARLAVFDLDGTLVNTGTIEDRCYPRALRESLGVRAVDDDWTRYHHVSDTGIAAEVHELEFGAPLTVDAMERTAAYFVDLLRTEWEADRALITPIAGALALLDALPGHGWAVAIATGCWRRSADFKFGAAGIAHAGLPMATSEDGPARVDIVQTAIQRAGAMHGVARFDRIVSVGDGVWDVTAAADLALPFLGVGRDARAERLRAAGSGSVVGDFTELPRVLHLLDTVAAPAIRRA